MNSNYEMGEAENNKINLLQWTGNLRHMPKNCKLEYKLDKMQIMPTR